MYYRYLGVVLALCIYSVHSQGQTTTEQDRKSPQQGPNIYSPWAQLTYDNVMNESIQLSSLCDGYISGLSGKRVEIERPLDTMIKKLKVINLFWDRSHGGGSSENFNDQFSALVELRCLIQENISRLKLAYDTRIPEQGLLHLCFQLDSRFELNLVTKLQAKVRKILEDTEHEANPPSRELLRAIWEFEQKSPVTSEDLMHAFEAAQGKRPSKFIT